MPSIDKAVNTAVVIIDVNTIITSCSFDSNFYFICQIPHFFIQCSSFPLLSIPQSKQCAIKQRLILIQYDAVNPKTNLCQSSPPKLLMDCPEVNALMQLVYDSKLIKRYNIYRKLLNLFSLKN